VKTQNRNLAELRLGPSAERKFTTEVWCVLMLHGGILTWTGKGRVLEARPGDAVVLSPGTRAAVRGRTPGELIGYYFCFHAEEVGSVFGTPMRILFEKAARDSELARILPPRSPVTRKLKALILEGRPVNTPEQRCQILALLPPLIRELQSDLPGEHDGNDGAKGRILAALVQLTDSEICKVSVEELAEKCNCSRRHLTRLVKEHFGCSVVELKNQVRLDRAAVLLKNPKAKVIDVAMECGFNHHGQFAAQFRERFGMTPTEWRAKAGGNGGDTLALREERTRRDLHPASLRSDPEQAAAVGIAAWNAPHQDFLSCL
jgi:AraC-like DNA-binding protein